MVTKRYFVSHLIVGLAMLCLPNFWIRKMTPIDRREILLTAFAVSENANAANAPTF